MPPLDNAAPYEQMGPTMLAAQPPSAPKSSDPAPGKNWDRIFAHLESRLAGLRSWRWSWWAYWAELARFLLPRRYRWLVVANRMGSRGSPINNSIIDSTGTLAMQTCAAGLWTGLTSPSRPWFKLGMAMPWVKPDKDGKDWLEDTEQRLATVFSQSNFYNTMAQAFQDVATFGTAPVIIYEDVEDLIRCFLPCAGQYYLDVGARLSVDTLYREETMNVVQIVEMFRLVNCPPQVRELWNTGGASWQTEFVICHAIEPNAPLSNWGTLTGEIRVVPARFPFREVYWLKGNNTKAELSRRGFHERPFMAARWSVASNDPYGRSPGMDALGDTKQLQLETLRKAEFIEKLVRPPMIADVSMKNEPASIIPANITYVDTSNNRAGFKPAFEVAPAALSPMIEDIKEVEKRIEDCFFVRLFMAISQMEGVQPRNELELTKRDLERLQTLGPFINLFETEFAGPAVERTLAILQRRGMLKPMPDSIKGMPLKIEYISILKLAQRAAQAIAMKDTFQTAGELSAAAKAAGVADPIRTINLDKALKDYAEVTNFPMEDFYSDQEVAQHDQMRLDHAQQQQALQATIPAVQAAKTLSDTDPKSGALAAILGQSAVRP